MERGRFIGMAAAVALASACKDDTQRITLANCETGPKAEVYEATISNDHRLNFYNMNMLSPEHDITAYANKETNILRNAMKNDKSLDIHIEPVSSTEYTLRVGVECKNNPSSK